MAVFSTVPLSETTTDLRLDAEYYQPQYLQEADAITAGPFERLSSIADVTDGNHLAIAEAFCERGIRYLRGQDLGDFFIRDTDPVFIPEAEYRALTRSHMRPGDILIGIVGTIGSVGLVTDRHGPLTGNCKLAIVRPHRIEPEFLAVYLASRVGQNELLRSVRGAVQMGLILPDLKALPVPTLEEKLRDEVVNKVRVAYSERQDSQRLYASAGRLFCEETGLKDVDLSPTLYFERRYSETQTASRVDAEFFQPKYPRLLAALGGTKPERIDKLVDYRSFLTNGHTPLHHNLLEGEVPFLTAEHVFDFRLEYDSEKRIRLEHHVGELARTQLCNGDFLITIKGRVGNAAVAEDVPGKVNINQDVALLRLRGGLPPYYLLAYLNSVVGKAFVEEYCTGQINPFLGLGNLQLLPIAIYAPSVMKAIAAKAHGLVMAARSARSHSRRLLEEAKRMIDATVVNDVNARH